nr:unnamed protein product [Callosobruchus analis]
MRAVHIAVECICLTCALVLASEERDQSKNDVGTNEVVSPWKLIMNVLTERPESKAISNLVEVKGDIEGQTKLVCSEKESPPFFSLPCSKTRDCAILRDSELICCKNRCVKGKHSPISEEDKHPATFFGIVEQECPKELLPEVKEVEKCESDHHCSPRICCPYTLKSGENVSYCRTPQPVLDSIPLVGELAENVRSNLIAYMQCTPPPPPEFDLHPKPCEAPLDCFPNLCCQEGGKKYCRPPKRNILTLIADVGQRVIPTDVAREFIKRIS